MKIQDEFKEVHAEWTRQCETEVRIKKFAVEQVILHHTQLLARENFS